VGCIKGGINDTARGCRREVVCRECKIEGKRIEETGKRWRMWKGDKRREKNLVLG
jgi:hypothetical protein